MADFFRRTGLLPGTAFVVASDAPVATIRQARILKARYGALIQISDGTADDVEIQAAIDALTAQRARKEKVVVIGNFTLAGTVNIPAYTILEIQGMLKMANATNLRALELTGDNVEICGGIIDGNRANQTVGVRTINIVGRTKVVIRGLFIKSWLGSPIFNIYNAQDILIQDCRIEDLDTTALRFAVAIGLGLNIRIVGNDFVAQVQDDIDSSKTSVISNRLKGLTGSHGVVYLLGKDNLVLGNTITGASAGHGGVEVRGYGNNVIGNVLESNGIGIDLEASGATDDVRRNVVTGNIVRNNGGHGIRLTRAAGTLADNLVTDNSCIDNGGRGIIIDNVIADNIRIENNILLGNVAPQFEKGATPTNIIVKGNIGYVTENSGTATITGAVDEVAVTHGLATTPTRVFVQAQQSGQGDYWISAKAATTFTISFITQPGASTWTFDWRAQVGEG